jgi:hypothetical protein
MKWLFILVLFLSSRSTVVFTVLDSQGTPIVGAEIYFCARKAVTDIEGMATFVDIPAPADTLYGGCTLEIRKEGYQTVTDAFAVTEDMALTYTLYSDVMVTISGTVYFDSSDNPAAFVVVRIYDVVTDEVLPPVLTDEKGQFSFEVSVDRSVYVVISDYEDQKFYLSPEQEHIVVIATKGIVSDVEISVLDEKGNPLEAVHITLTSGTAVYEGKTDATGKLLIGDVTNGEYTLNAEKEGFASIERKVTIISRERGGVCTVDIFMEKATGSLTVAVHSISGDALFSQIVITSEGKEILLLDVEGDETILLAAGMYSVEANAPGYESARRQVVLLEDQTKKIELFLEESQRTVRVASEPFPWLIAAVLAVIAVIFTLYLLKTR